MKIIATTDDNTLKLYGSPQTETQSPKDINTKEPGVLQTEQKKSTTTYVIDEVDCEACQ